MFSKLILFSGLFSKHKSKILIGLGVVIVIAVIATIVSKQKTMPQAESKEVSNEQN